MAGNLCYVAVQIYTWINANDELSSVEFVTGGETALPNRSAHLIVYLKYCYISVYTRID